MVYITPSIPTVMRNEFSTLDIVKALEIPREKLKEWMKRGFIRPTIPASGQGIKAVFTRADVYAVSLFEELIKKGFKREIASGFVLAISAWEQAPAEISIKNDVFIKLLIVLYIYS